jgi:uncharacterized metal-binding protein
VVTAFLSYLGATFLLSPDLDLNHSIPTRNWGILKFIWMGYPRIFRHRGKSHSLFFSSLTKIVYLIVVGIALIASFLFFSKIYDQRSLAIALDETVGESHSLLQDILNRVIPYKRYFISSLIGITLSDWVHILSDRIFSTVKRLAQ